MARVPHRRQIPLLAALVGGRPVEPADHAALETAALEHRLHGYADAAISEGRWRAPADVAGRLRDARARAAARGALLRRELALAAPVIEAACGARPIVVKGPVVAERLHGDRTLRPYFDLDVVVPRPRLRAAAAALMESGWEPAEKIRSTGAVGEPLEGWAEAYGHELHLRRAIGAHTADLELHWRVSDDAAAARLDHGRLAARAVELPALGAGVLAPDPADELLLVALHLLHHREVRLVWALDVALARDALDALGWERAFTTAEELDLAWALHTALDRAEALLGGGRARPRERPRHATFGALRARQLLPGRAGEHAGRLAQLGWSGRGRYARDVGVATWRRVARRARGS